MTKLCAHCQLRSPGEMKNFGSPIRCAFPDNGKFSADNWMCATALAIRDLCSKYGEPSSSDPEFSRRLWQGDTNYAMIQLGDYEDMDLPSGESLCLWVSWYKRRGHTSAMWILSEEAPPRLPMFDDCSRILARLPTPQNLAAVHG